MFTRKYEILTYKEIVALRDFVYKVWFVQFGFWKFVFADNSDLEIIFFTKVKLK